MSFQKIEPSVFKFEKEGDEIQGKLLKIEDSKQYKNKVYTLETKKGYEVVFGTTIIDERMKIVNIGDRVKIVFIKIDQNKKGQDVKIFDVYMDK